MQQWPNGRPCWLHGENDKHELHCLLHNCSNSLGTCCVFCNALKVGLDTHTIEAEMWFDTDSEILTWSLIFHCISDLVTTSQVKHQICASEWSEGATWAAQHRSAVQRRYHTHVWLLICFSGGHIDIHMVLLYHCLAFLFVWRHPCCVLLSHQWCLKVLLSVVAPEELCFMSKITVSCVTWCGRTLNHYDHKKQEQPDVWWSFFSNLFNTDNTSTNSKMEKKQKFCTETSCLYLLQLYPPKLKLVLKHGTILIPKQHSNFKHKEPPPGEYKMHSSVEWLVSLILVIQPSCSINRSMCISTL